MRRGRRYADAPKCHVLSQRYTEAEQRLIKSVLGHGGKLNEFIRSAALDRARLFADQGGSIS